MKKLTVITSLVFLLLFSTAAMGQMMQRGQRHGMWNTYQSTPEQEQAYQDIIDQYQPKFSNLADKMWSKRAELNGAIAQENVDRAKANELAKEVGDLLSQCYRLQVDMMLDMREKGVSYYGMGMMHGGMMGGGMMDMMMGGMMDMMMGGQWNRSQDRQYPTDGRPYQRNRGMMQ